MGELVESSVLGFESKLFIDGFERGEGKSNVESHPAEFVISLFTRLSGTPMDNPHGTQCIWAGLARVRECR